MEQLSDIFEFVEQNAHSLPAPVILSAPEGEKLDDRPPSEYMFPEGEKLDDRSPSEYMFNDCAR